MLLLERLVYYGAILRNTMVFSWFLFGIACEVSAVQDLVNNVVEIVALVIPGEVRILVFVIIINNFVNVISLARLQALERMISSILRVLMLHILGNARPFLIQLKLSLSSCLFLILRVLLLESTNVVFDHFVVLRLLGRIDEVFLLHLIKLQCLGHETCFLEFLDLVFEIQVVLLGLDDAFYSETFLLHQSV